MKTNILLLTKDLCVFKVNKKTLEQYQCFKQFSYDFSKHGAVVKTKLSNPQLKTYMGDTITLSSKAVIQYKNKTYLVTGYCEVTEYKNKINALKDDNAKKTKRRNLYNGLKQFTKGRGAVMIDNEVYFFKNPITYKAIN